MHSRAMASSLGMILNRTTFYQTAILKLTYSVVTGKIHLIDGGGKLPFVTNVIGPRVEILKNVYPPNLYR